MTEKVSEVRIPLNGSVSQERSEQVCRPIDVHRFTHFERPRHSESMEYYRKNKNLFDFTAERPSKKECLVTSKIGAQEAILEFAQNNSSKLSVSRSR